MAKNINDWMRSLRRGAAPGAALGLMLGLCAGGAEALGATCTNEVLVADGGDPYAVNGLFAEDMNGDGTPDLPNMSGVEGPGWFENSSSAGTLSLAGESVDDVLLNGTLVAVVQLDDPSEDDPACENAVCLDAVLRDNFALGRLYAVPFEVSGNPAEGHFDLDHLCEPADGCGATKSELGWFHEDEDLVGYPIVAPFIAGGWPQIAYATEKEIRFIPLEESILSLDYATPSEPTPDALTVVVLSNNSGFVQSPPYDTQYQRVRVGDFNDDGIADLVAMSKTASSNDYDLHFWVGSRTDEGTDPLEAEFAFTPAGIHNIGPSADGLAVGYLNGDGYQDLAFVRENYSSSTTLRTVLVEPDTTSPPTFTLTIGSHSTGDNKHFKSLTIGDIWAGGSCGTHTDSLTGQTVPLCQDVAFGMNTTKVAVYPNVSTSSTFSLDSYTTIDTPYSVTRVLITNLDQDTAGRGDLLINTVGARLYHYLQNTSDEICPQP